jgi:hypothetical protein
MADNWLKPYQFIALLLPRRNLNPGDVMFRGNGNFDQKVGDLSMLLASAAALPQTTSGEPTGSIARSFEKRVDLGLGAKILGALFGGAASSKLGADLEAKRASSMSMTYEDVTQDSMPVLELQLWLQGTTIKVPGQTTRWLNDNKLAAVTAVLRTATLSVVATQESGASIELNVPEIQGLVGGDVKVSRRSSASSKITFSGKEPIAFGFQAFVMLFEDNVSFGLEQTRALEAEEVTAAAWTSDDELAAVSDRPLLA